MVAFTPGRVIRRAAAGLGQPIRAAPPLLGGLEVLLREALRVRVRARSDPLDIGLAVNAELLGRHEKLHERENVATRVPPGVVVPLYPFVDGAGVDVTP
jgi:hypothetical protein